MFTTDTYIAAPFNGCILVVVLVFDIKCDSNGFAKEYPAELS